MHGRPWLGDVCGPRASKLEVSPTITEVTTSVSKWPTHRVPPVYEYRDLPRRRYWSNKVLDDEHCCAS